MDEITVSDGAENSSFITYLYNYVMQALSASGGAGELILGERTVFQMKTAKREREIRALLREKIAEVIGIGYKYRFLKEKLRVALPAYERQLLCAALIAADLEGDKAYIKSKLTCSAQYAIDGIYAFRLSPLREKWERIIAYIPSSFSSYDLKKFCAFLAGESSRKVYVRGREVYNERFIPLRRSRLTGEERVETEIMLSDAGFVYCLGDVDRPVGDFLQKYYAERAVFS